MLWERLVTDLVAKGHAVASAMDAAEAVLRARRARVAQGFIGLARAGVDARVGDQRVA
jgi:hypothetical protein